MKGPLSIFTSREFWIGLGVVLLVALVLLAALVMGWSLVVTALALAVALLLVGLVLMMRRMKAAQASSGIEQQIMAQAQAQQQTVRPDQQAEIEQLQQDLERAIETLKHSKLGKRGWRPGGGKAALYALPWYLFIGPPGAGKTTAIANSGLNFPVGTDRVRGVGGTRDCDWFFTDQAILLDTAGRYVTEREDNDEWIAFLEILKKHRKERPINGVLVGIALDELAGASPAEVERHAATVRARIDELVQHLGVRFPVYLLFTKADLLQGFAEFFGEFDRREREAIWGATLDPEAPEDGGFRALFEREFDLLAEALSGVRSRRLRRAMKREERKLVYTFPLQFASLKGTLGPFVEQLFRPNPYQETPIFRGFYFTSGTQEGVPIDRVIRAIEAEFDLPPEMTPLAPNEETKSYFIKDLFTEVVIPDQYLGRRTSRAATRRRLARAGTSVAAIAALALFLLGTSQALVRSRLDLNRARDAAADAALVQWNEDRPSATDLGRMEALRAELDRLGGGVPLLQLGLSRRGEVLDPARSLYHSRARAFVEAYPLATLRRRLARVPADSAARATAYDDLKAYLLLTSDTERLADEADAGFLRQYLTGVTYETLYGADTAAVGRVAPEGLERHLAALVEGLRAGRVRGFEPEAGLVAQTRDLIYEQPSVQGVYNRLRSEGRAAVPPLRLADVVPARFHLLFQVGGGGASVPGFFTQRGWDEFAQEAFETEAEDPSRDDWVLGRTAGERPAEMQEPAEMLAQLEALYFDDYARTWKRFMQGVRYRPFGDARTAVAALDKLSDTSDSPLLHLLARVTAETTFGGVPGGETGEGIVDAVRRRGNRALRGATGVRVEGGEAAPHPVLGQFTGLHALEAEKAVSGGAAAELYQALEALQRVGSVLEAAAADPAQAAEFATAVLEQNGGQFETARRQIGTGLRRLDADVRRRLFEEPVLVAWEAILGGAQGYLDGRWRDEVQDPFQRTLAGRYPFDANSRQEVPLGDFETFFHPSDGTLALFYDEALAPFLTRDGRPRGWGGRSIVLSSRTQAALDQARAIGEALFSGGTLRLDFELQADQPEREGDAPVPSQVYVSIHGQEDAYRMGSQSWTSFSWPGSSPGALLSVSTDRGDLPPKQFEGDWAWFRLLQQADPRRVSSAQYELRWPFGQPGEYVVTALYTLRTRNSSAPFDNPVRFFTFSPPAALN